MRITLKIGAASIRCQTIEGGKFVAPVYDDPSPGDTAPPESCETCRDLYALRDGYGTVRGLFRSFGGAEHHRAGLESEHGRLELETPPGRLARSLRIIALDARELSHGYEGAAVCERCRRDVGRLEVEDSLFGHDEDRRTLNGRCRVY